MGFGEWAGALTTGGLAVSLLAWFRKARERKGRNFSNHAKERKRGQVDLFPSRPRGRG